MKDFFRRFLIRILLPITKLIGMLHFSPRQRALFYQDTLDLKGVVRNGDVLLSYSYGELTNLLIPGEYKHCAIYVDGRVVEATHIGVCSTPFEDFCASKDMVAICRPIFCGEQEMAEAVRYAVNQEGLAYDYYFEPNEEAFYCAELIAKAYEHATSGASPFKTRLTLGVETVLPIDFKLATKKFKTVLERPTGQG